MSDPYPNLEPWEAYEQACKDIAELEAENKRLKKDQQRLEFVINNSGVLRSDCETYSISYFRPPCSSPFGSQTGYYPDWRDAIDEAMGEDGDVAD